MGTAAPSGPGLLAATPLGRHVGGGGVWGGVGGGGSFSDLAAASRESIGLRSGGGGGKSSFGGGGGGDWRAIQDELLNLRDYQPPGEDRSTGAQPPPSATFASLRDFLRRTASARTAHPALSADLPRGTGSFGTSSGFGGGSSSSSSSSLARDSAAQKLEQPRAALRRLGILLDETLEAQSVSSGRDEALEVVWLLARLGPPVDNPFRDHGRSSYRGEYDDDDTSGSSGSGGWGASRGSGQGGRRVADHSVSYAAERAARQRLHRDLDALAPALRSTRCADLLDQVAGFAARPAPTDGRGSSAHHPSRRLPGPPAHRLTEVLAAWLTLAVAAFHDANPLPRAVVSASAAAGASSSSSLTSSSSSFFDDLKLSASSRAHNDPNPFLADAGSSTRTSSRAPGGVRPAQRAAPPSGAVAAHPENAGGVAGWFQRAKERAVVLLANPEVQLALGF
jgi:hypothetical protein